MCMHVCHHHDLREYVVEDFRVDQTSFHYQINGRQNLAKLWITVVVELLGLLDQGQIRVNMIIDKHIMIQYTSNDRVIYACILKKKAILYAVFIGVDIFMIR